MHVASRYTPACMQTRLCTGHSTYLPTDFIRNVNGEYARDHAVDKHHITSRFQISRFHPGIKYSFGSVSCEGAGE